jgi:hypothetical protein
MYAGLQFLQLRRAQWLFQHVLVRLYQGNNHSRKALFNALHRVAYVTNIACSYVAKSAQVFVARNHRRRPVRMGKGVR